VLTSQKALTILFEAGTGQLVELDRYEKPRIRKKRSGGFTAYQRYDLLDILLLKDNISNVGSAGNVGTE